MKQLPKTIFAIFSIFILNLTFYIPTAAAAASLSLSPSSKTINKECKFSVDILIDTGSSETDGADAILIYDTTRLKADKIRNGMVYSEYPLSSIDVQSGKINISSMASVSSPFKGSGTLATIDFSVLADAPEGATQVNFDFDPNDKGKTSDSNIAERGTMTDILSSVTNGSYTVGAGTCSSSGSSGTSGGSGRTGGEASGSGTTRRPQGGADSGEPVPTKAPLPKSGFFESTLMVLGAGGMFAVLGILGLSLQSVKR